MDIRLIGQRIRQARERLNLSQEELAFRIGKSQNAISLYEKGERAIHLSELDILARALDVPISYIFGEDFPEDEISALAAQFPAERKHEIVARLRLELDLMKAKG